MTIEELARLIGGATAPVELELDKLAPISIPTETAKGLETALTKQSEIDGRLPASIDALGTQIEGLRLVQESQAFALSENTRALVENLAGRIGQSLVSGTSEIGSLGGGSVLAPWIGPLLGLLGGRDRADTTLPIVADRPDPINIQREIRVDGSRQNGQTGSPVSINVNVQAMDSRSFVDHSNEIAGALRRALLESHSVRDVLEDM